MREVVRYMTGARQKALQILSPAELEALEAAGLEIVEKERVRKMYAVALTAEAFHMALESFRGEGTNDESKSRQPGYGFGADDRVRE